MRTVFLLLALLCLSDTIGSAIYVETPSTTDASPSHTTPPPEEESPPKENPQEKMNSPETATEEYNPPIKVAVTIEEKKYPIYFGVWIIPKRQGFSRRLILDTIQPGEGAKVLPPSQETQALIFENFNAPASLPVTNPLSINAEGKDKKITIDVVLQDGILFGQHMVSMRDTVVTVGKGKTPHSVVVKYV